MTNNKSLRKAESSQPAKVRKYDLDHRTHVFARAVREFVRNLPQTMANVEDGKQLIRSSGSVCANYFEASSAISRKDFVHRIKLCRKEAKESWHWLDCIHPGKSTEMQTEHRKLLQESLELLRIFSACIRTLQRS